MESENVERVDPNPGHEPGVEGRGLRVRETDIAKRSFGLRGRQPSISRRLTESPKRVLGLFFIVAFLFARAFGADIPSASNTVLFEFREPRRTVYFVERPLESSRTSKSLLPKSEWVRAWPKIGRGDSVEFGNRLVLQVADPEKLPAILDGFPLRISRRLTSHICIVEAVDAWIAMDAASELSNHPMVSACYPVARRSRKLLGDLFPIPNDPYFAKSKNPDFPWQAYLENRDLDGTRLGVDLNVREAWTRSLGSGIVIAVADDGVDLSHPDLASQAANMPHFNFATFSESGIPLGSSANHGTAVAGLALAKGNNKTGILGVAPEAHLASWVLFNARDQFVISDERLMDMFQYRSNVVSIQNHSWGNDSTVQFPVSTLENIGISNAVTFGRSGKGVVLVRAGGNGRDRSINANDDGYLTDPRVIGVAAIRLDGKFARYGSQGACLLVAAPSGDEDPVANPCSTNAPNILTTDRQRSAGYNSNTYTNDLANYGFGATGFNGTSASTPQISGVAALILSANTNLTYRDVQQILILSSRHFDLADPDLAENGAGFPVSHNLGFGIPDAGLAVSLAKTWQHRPAMKRVEFASNQTREIPDQGLRVLVTGESIPPEIQSIIALPGLGRFPDLPTANFSAMDVGTTVDGVPAGLGGRAALVQRGENFFCEKLSAVTEADAALAIVYNNRDTSARIVMGATEYTPIPAVFINQRDGEALRDVVQADPSARLRLSLQTIDYAFEVPDSLLCEHVSVRVDGDHTARGDLRITLRSPQGTRSVLQTLSDDDSMGPQDWTYLSTHHFYENSAGNWTVSVSDLGEKGTGSILSVSLVIQGVPLNDSDRDGLDDVWETRFFGNLFWGGKDDPDGDGRNNAWEQIASSDPAKSETSFQLDIARWNGEWARLSWPGMTGTVYRVSVGSEPLALQTLITNIPGVFPETEVFVPYTDVTHRFYQVEELSKAPQQR